MRLINADALIRDIKSEIAEDKELYPDKDWLQYFDSGMINAIRLVRRQPSIDIEIHGRWVRVSEYDITDNAHFMCSVCKQYENHAKNDVVDHCPHCGAKMDGDKNETN